MLCVTMYGILDVRFFLPKDATPNKISTLSLHDALPISLRRRTRPTPSATIVTKLKKRVSSTVAVPPSREAGGAGDRKSTRLNSSHVESSYAVFCLKKKNLWCEE